MKIEINKKEYEFKNTYKGVKYFEENYNKSLTNIFSKDAKFTDLIELFYSFLIVDNEFDMNIDDFYEYINDNPVLINDFQTVLLGKKK